MPKIKTQSIEDQQLAHTQWNRYVRARDNGHLDFVEMAKKCDAFYRGDQWDKADLLKLNSEGRPALTINTILPTVNTVLGEQSTRRSDVQFKPRRSGDQDVSTVLTKLYMQIADNNKLDWVEQQVFSDGLIMDGRGYFDVRMDFSDHIEGEIRIIAKDPLDILIDPDAKEYDPKTWNEVFETRWMTLDEIEELYGAELQRFHLFLVLVERAVRVHLDLDRAVGVLLGERLELLRSHALGRVLRDDMAELDHDGVRSKRRSGQTDGDQTDQKRTNLHESISSERTASR